MVEIANQSVFVTHWHEDNPWKDSILYVPLEELAACDASLVGPSIYGGSPARTIEGTLDHWKQSGSKLDAYILVGSVRSGGVRYGPEGSDYLSPMFSLPKIHALKQKYQT